MEMLQENIILWIVLAVVLILGVIIVVSVIIGKKRKREVEELDRLFPDGGMDSDNVKISVEKVRRHALERERRQAKNVIHRERPKEGEKVLPDEDKEIIIRDPSMLPPKSQPKAESEKKSATRSSWSRSRADKQADANQQEPASNLESLGQLDESMKEKSFAVRSTTRKAQKEAKGDAEKDQIKDRTKEFSKTPVSKTEEDPAASRRMYKRSLLKDRSSDGGEMPKASLIDSSMVHGEDQKQEEVPSTLSRSSKNEGKSWFSK